MIDTDKYEGHLLINGEFSKQVMTPEQYNATKALLNDAPLLLAEVKRLREESKKKGDVLTTLDEMIRNYTSHVEMMKALEQGLDLTETWKELIE